LPIIRGGKAVGIRVRDHSARLARSGGGCKAAPDFFLAPGPRRA
jgi:hypothetical protein